MKKIQMLDLGTQYLNIQTEIDNAIKRVIDSAQFIRGNEVESFEKELAEYLGVKNVIACGNGTDALQIALMSLDLDKGDEVICPSFSFISGAEVTGLLGLSPVFVDVDYDSFLTTKEHILKAITNKTKVIMPVHLFGQGVEMEEIIKIAKQYNLYIIEDNAQALGADYSFSNGEKKKLGTIGNIGCTSFFPSKNLGCYGDGGAVFTNDDNLAERIRLIANHGMKKKYSHERIGVNSRLDSLQAAILREKLKHLDEYIFARQQAAKYYTDNLSSCTGIVLPRQVWYCEHSYHQYTIKVLNNQRDALKDYLQQKDIPTAIYYPQALHKQQAFATIQSNKQAIEVSEQLCNQVLSLPMHTELCIEQLEYIVKSIKQFFEEQ
ncbi:MAG: DegT/DnrJ/EryC1/StrS family aminotransferase [Bacteroidales bacterium]|nr:DegT/DnrJ/EryC1/StrS family aminotransferase [Bacteroidales bacterium]